MLGPRCRQWLLLSALVLGACAPYDSRARDNSVVDVGVYSHVSQAGPEFGRHYRVVSSGSKLTVLARRAGRLAILGHNHVLVSKSLQGWADVAENIEHSSFALRLPLTSLVLDQVDARAEAGPEFIKSVSAQSIAATRNNLLGEELLNVRAFPFLEVRSLSVRQGVEETNFWLELSISLKGVARSITVPASIHVTPERLDVYTSFKVAQSALGLQPFSVLGGAIAVADELEINLSIRAVHLGAGLSQHSPSRHKSR